MINDYRVSKPCFSNYQPSNLCDTCWAAELCKAEAIRLDGYYDRQEEERSWWLDYETTHLQSVRGEAGLI